MKLKTSFLALSLALTGCLADGEEPTLSEDTNELYAPTGTTLVPRNTPIRVCWVTVTLPGESMPPSTLRAAKDQFREELKNSWERWANIQFTGFNECPTSGSDRYVRIQIRWQGTNPMTGESNDSGGACVASVKASISCPRRTARRQTTVASAAASVRIASTTARRSPKRSATRFVHAGNTSRSTRWDTSSALVTSKIETARAVA